MVWYNHVKILFNYYTDLTVTWLYTGIGSKKTVPIQDNPFENHIGFDSFFCVV